MSARRLGRVFVTGADGFIGSHLTERLVRDGHDVTALCIYNSNGSFGWLDALARARPTNLRLVLGDIRDAGFLESSIAGHQTVLHLAALIAIPYSYVAPRSYFETNCLGTLNVAQACLKAGVERLVSTSTSEVYGTARTVPICEEHPLQGQSPYSASKISADMVIDSHVRSFSLPAVTLRPFNTYGPRQSLRAVLPTIIGQLVQGRRELHLGNLDATRDFNFVDDTVEAFLAVAAGNDELIGQTFNAGSGREIAIGDVARLIGRLMGVEISIRVEDARLRPERSEVQRLLADSRRLMVATGWRPRTTLEEGIGRLIGWMREHEAERPADLYQI